MNQQLPSSLPQPISPSLASTMSMQEQQLKALWQQQLQEVQELGPDRTIFKNPELPLTRIKKIMKSDEDVKMIAAEAPVLFAKACEMFILDLTVRSWNQAEQVKRRTLQRSDVAGAVATTDIFDFLVDVVPQEGVQPGEASASVASTAFPQPSNLTAPHMHGALHLPPGNLPPALHAQLNTMMPPPGLSGNINMPPHALPPQFMHSMMPPDGAASQPLPNVGVKRNWGDAGMDAPGKP